MLKKVVSLILCAFIISCAFLPYGVHATSDTLNEDIIIEEETNEWDGTCLVKVKLNGKISDKTDNIKINFSKKGFMATANTITLSRENNFTGTISLLPDDYNISFVSADNKYEVIIDENFASIPEAESANITLNVKKVRNGSFIVSFFRNNSFLLIILAISSVAYFHLRKKRLATTINNIQ